MITINFEGREKVPLWEWIYLSIKHQIENEVLVSGEKLPSKRNLASHLGVSIITVQTAYQQLIDEGWIYSIEKKGFFVTDIRNSKEARCFRKIREDNVRAHAELFHVLREVIV